jgi:anhydro-N-acetylmuramic acid kinase
VRRWSSEQGVPLSTVDLVGFHGQTITHRPERRFTWQSGDGAALARALGVDVVADFRSRDVAAGGQGAPLVPAFHRAVFGSAGETRVVLNVGGIANISVLDGDGDAHVTGFDTGPGNVLMDHWIARHLGLPYDADGAWAASGTVQTALLATLCADPYFALPPPKSTGRDLFNADWLNRWLAPHGLTDSSLSDTALARDVQATLCELTARSAALALREHAPDAVDVVVCGGGALNSDKMRRLSEQLAGVRVGRSDAHGLDVMQVEAAAFAWLAWTHVHRLAGNVPEVTGARGQRILGALYPTR